MNGPRDNHGTIVAAESSESASNDDFSFKLEIEKMTADADAILDSIRLEATKSPEKPKRSQKRGGTRSEKKLVVTLGPQFMEADRAKDAKSSHNNHVPTTTTTNEEEEENESHGNLNHSLSSEHEGSLSDDTADDCSLGSLADELKRQMAAELMAAELSAAEEEFHNQLPPVLASANFPNTSTTLGHSSQGLLLSSSSQHSKQHQHQQGPSNSQPLESDANVFILIPAVVIVWTMILFIVTILLSKQQERVLLDDLGTMTFPAVKLMWYELFSHV